MDLGPVVAMDTKIGISPSKRHRAAPFAYAGNELPAGRADVLTAALVPPVAILIELHSRGYPSVPVGAGKKAHCHVSLANSGEAAGA